ncbi:Prephenate dehydratase [uncultured archaeon]|nr:Prephenate dehydratase [uncultured archaeon]
MKIGVLGPEGTYSEKAALCWSKGKPDAILVYFPNFEDVLMAVESGALDVGVVPVENSLEGAVPQVMDSLRKLQVVITDEVNLQIRHCLLARGNGEIKVVLSHPQPLAQCRQYLREHYPQAEARATSSTSHAAKLASESLETAAIAEAGTAEKYGLRILARDIQDVQDNTTRFVVAGRKMPEATGHDKTSLVIYLEKDRPGALFSILQEFAELEINLTRIESRPSRRGLGDYYFYIDLEGHVSDEKVRAALAGIGEKAAMVKVLGSYPRA